MIRSGMLRFALLLAAGCATQTQPSCDPDVQISNDVSALDAAAVVDCGRALDVAVDGGLTPAMKMGHDCVLAAFSKHQPFRFLFADPRNGLTSGLSAVPSGQRLLVKWYTSGPPGTKQLSVQTCNDGVQGSPSCTPSGGVPCLQCLTPMGALICGG